MIAARQALDLDQVLDGAVTLTNVRLPSQSLGCPSVGGLAIVREIIERHGGGVRAEGRSPSGLVIVLELPAAKSG